MLLQLRGRYIGGLETGWLYRFLYASVHSERFELSQKAQGLGSA
jgi:hypothetical protein